MRKTMMILALAIGTGFLFTSAVNAISPMQFTGLMMNFNSSDRYEKTIMLNDWMISVESFTGISRNPVETEPEISSWMLDPSWESNRDRLDSDPELKLEDWMLKVTRTNIKG